MFLGRYTHNLDAKGRLIIPAKYREMVAGGAYIVQGFDRNLLILTAPLFDKITERVNALSITDPNARKLKRLIFSTADQVDIDRTGRILIPQFLRDIAKLESEVEIIGSGMYFELWSPAFWQEQVNILEDTETNEERFAALDLGV